ncbi:hypothetical protein LUZ63_012609 [Rhynchospora breviuscula]|uniref:Citrate transporter-like domain-containing protein n=1 Tax=Rhynchospora breviuscula TaxID=2022672 RepID=A0A9Q0CL51_9POAL|nr:hypothetical protein LUZ63_012609 [Rhynchospora breviuscula]
MLVGLLVNAGILLCCFWKTLSVKKKDVEAASTVTDDVEVDNEMNSHRFSPATMSHQSSFNSQDLDATLDSAGVAGVGESSLRSRHCSSKTEIELMAPDMKEAGTPGISSIGESVVLVNGMESGRLMRQREVVNDVCLAMDAKEVPVRGWKRIGRKVLIYAVTLGMLVAFLMGLDLSWTAITTALALMLIDFKDAQPCLQKVSYSLLIFFCGMFITVDGLNSTGIPSALWDLVEPYSQVDTACGLALLSLMVLVLSNIASNVPTVLLLGARVAASAAKRSTSEVTKAWLILAFVSTVAGNLSLLGSAANLIVCEQARRAPVSKYNLSFFSHLCFGIPSTIVVTIVGVLLLFVS